MSRQALIGGGGIGGLAVALALSRAGWHARVYEKADAFLEVGAGVQLGPNAMRVLHGWGLAGALARVAAFPDRLRVLSALSSRELGVLPLGQRTLKKYGAPYATVHRADLHGVLLQAVRGQDNIWLKLRTGVAAYADSGHEVTLTMYAAAPVQEVEGDALIGADGLWSRVRELMLNDGPPRNTGHLAYRALVSQASLPERLRSQQVTAWLGPGLHAVQYPVCGGEKLNVVVIVQGTVEGDPQSWDHSANAADLQGATAFTAAPLRELIQAISDGGSASDPAWRLWALCDRPPMTGPHQHARGRVALLGDAAHPMLPYLAQGAGMAIEDAAELGAALAPALDPAIDVSTMLQRYALNRWQRNARVQARSLRNGEVFHSGGVTRLGRDAAMRLLGSRVLDLPWLYGVGPRVS